MSTEPKRWQTKVWTGRDFDEPHVFFGSTQPNLRNAVRQWLIENKPTDFANDHWEFEHSRRFSYGYSDGTRTPLFPLSRNWSESPLEEGWHYI